MTVLCLVCGCIGIGVAMCEFTLMSVSSGAPDMCLFALQVFAE